MNTKFLKLLYFSVIIFTIFSQVRCNISGCVSNDQSKKNKTISQIMLLYKNNNHKNDIIEQWNDLKKDIKREILPSISNIRPKIYLLSQREVINTLIDDAFKDPKELNEILSSRNWDNSKLGNIVLIDSYILLYDYYYYVTVTNSDGYVLGTTTVAANRDDEMAGHFGTMCFTDSNKIPRKIISKDQALAILTNKYPNIDVSHAKIKASNIDSNELSWGWTIKIIDTIKVTDIDNIERSGNIFYINPDVYDISFFDTKSQSDKTQFIDSLRIRPRIALIDKDIFDDKIRKKIKSLNTNSSKEDWTNNYPKKYVIENMAKQYE